MYDNRHIILSMINHLKVNGWMDHTQSCTSVLQIKNTLHYIIFMILTHGNTILYVNIFKTCALKILFFRGHCCAIMAASPIGHQVSVIYP